ncbi:DoxX family protein [Tabrizicola sp.]|uniref:DoxX family protein n=1 Tax=Tabrizicola sp. TaxID=2005166 RepID=UPI002869EF0A|nr:DoxX family protein [Tabrizicola sp.]
MTLSHPLLGQRQISVALLAARLLLSLIFVHEGITLSTHFGGAMASFAKLGIPAPILLLTIALQLGAGLSVALGLYARIGALLLALFCIATALLFHTDFSSQNELLHFEKDLAMAGGLIAISVCGAGGIALDTIVRRVRAACKS